MQGQHQEYKALSDRLRHLDNQVRVQNLQRYPIHAYRMGDVIAVTSILFVAAICIYTAFSGSPVR